MKQFQKCVQRDLLHVFFFIYTLVQVVKIAKNV